MLSELYRHVHEEPLPNDKEHMETTLNYLEACSNIFEKGFLSHDRVMSLESDVLKNISRGFNFFSGWLDAILKKSNYCWHRILTQ